MRHSTFSQRKRHPGFTLVELLVVIAIIGTLVALLLPAVQAAREAARANTCRNNLKQLHTALTLRETSLGELPGYINKLGIPGDAAANQNRASWVVTTFPYLELTNVYDLWSKRGVNGNPNVASTQAFPSIEILICPSDPQEIEGVPSLSYVGNAGFVQNEGSTPENPANGVFFDRTRTDTAVIPASEWASPPKDGRDTAGEPMKKMTIAYIQAKGDGTTSTMLLSENVNATFWGYYDADGTQTAQMTPDKKYHFGFVWEQPATIISAIASGPSADIENNAQFRRINGPPEDLPQDTISTNLTPNYGFPTSNHPGGVQAAFVGGSVQFITDQIDNLVYGQLMTTNHKKSDLQDGQGNPESDTTRVKQPTDEDY